MNIEHGKTYTFKIDDLKFGTLDEASLVELFKDGRFVSPFLERQLALWFPELTHITGNKAYDHVDEFGNKYDAKNFTKHGLKFMPSKMLGSGRKYDYHACRDKINEHALNYIACDIVDFPNVRVKFYVGKRLLEKYPKAAVPFKDRELLFD